MKTFLHDDFLLENEYAKELFHDYAKDLPIIDYHNHLPPEEIRNDKNFKNITEVWLGGDHYKWRLMRANGVDEKYVTGSASDQEKFKQWAKTVPNTLGNPLYHWTHMELLNYFGIDDLLDEVSADEIWTKTNDALQQEHMSTRNLLLNNKVEFVGTTDDPVDSLEHHQALFKEDFSVRVAPSFRPDKALNIGNEHFVAYVEKLQEVVGKELTEYSSFLDGLAERIDYFDEQGCRASDHAIEEMFFESSSETEAGTIYRKKMNGETLTTEEIDKFKTYTLQFLADKYEQKDWAMQLHLGALRNNNTKMFELLGPDTGYDSIGDKLVAEKLAQFLDALVLNNSLPKTILYTLNPRDNYILATMAGNFQDGSYPGKVQFGTAWWFNDHIDGMEDQMNILANVGLIKHFLGMLTDSRSFLSFPRHDYFRRILCNMIGGWAEKGTAPKDMKLLGKYVEDISYYNAKRYFGL